MQQYDFVHDHQTCADFSRRCRSVGDLSASDRALTLNSRRNLPEPSISGNFSEMRKKYLMFVNCLEVLVAAVD